jgi:hypothetical protein
MMRWQLLVAMVKWNLEPTALVQVSVGSKANLVYPEFFIRARHLRASARSVLPFRASLPKSGSTALTYWNTAAPNIVASNNLRLYLPLYM